LRIAKMELATRNAALQRMKIVGGAPCCTW